MAVKDALHDFVDEMTQEEAKNALEALASVVGSSVRIVPVSPEEMASIEQGLAELDAGLGIPTKRRRSASDSGREDSMEQSIAPSVRRSWSSHSIFTAIG